MMNGFHSIQRLSSLCRLCLIPDFAIHPLFDPNDNSILQKLADILRLELHKEDGLPGYICQQCCFQLVSAVNFKQRCIASQHTLREHILQARASLGIRPCIPFSPGPPDVRNTSDEVPIKVDPYWDDCQEVDPLSVEAQGRSYLQVLKIEPPEVIEVDQDSTDDFLDSKRPLVEELISKEDDRMTIEPVDDLETHGHSDSDDCGSSEPLVDNEEESLTVEEIRANIVLSSVTTESERIKIEDQLFNKVPVVKLHPNAVELHPPQQTIEDSPPTAITESKTMSEGTWTDDLSNDSWNSSTGLDDGGSDWSVGSNQIVKEYFYKKMRNMSSTSLVRTRRNVNSDELNPDECIELKPRTRNRNTNTCRSRPEVNPDDCIESESSTENRNTDSRRRRGRPKVIPDECIESKSSSTNHNTNTRRRRGRPKVNPDDRIEPESSSTNHNTNTRRRRGRPKVNRYDCIEPKPTMEYLEPDSRASETGITDSMPEGSKKETCIICMQRFSCKTSRELHDKMYRDRLTCCACDRKFCFPVNLFQHKNSHLANKNFQCKYCPKIFLFVLHVAIHGKVHITDKTEGETCYVCEHSFPNISLLVKHYRLNHTGENAYECHHCKKVCDSAHELKAHYSSHKKPKTYPCPICYKTFHTYKGSNIHLATHKRTKQFDVV